MAMIPVHLAVEDDLSEVVLRRILSYLDRGYSIGTAYGKRGYGYLRQTIKGWNSAAKGTPFIVLTDLDRYECPAALIDEWLPVPRHPNLIFRIAVREVEAWLLADAKNLASYLGVRLSFVPLSPETLTDPKATLVDLAKRSRYHQVRGRIVPKPGSTARQGPDYNACLGSFVLGTWDIKLASQVSPSLLRMVDTLSEFKPKW